MPQIAVRLSGSELHMLDQAVAEGAFSTRAEAVREGIKLLQRELRETRIAASYRATYEAEPPNEEETRVLDVALALAGDALT